MNVKKVKKSKSKDKKGGALPAGMRMKVQDGKVYMSYDGGKTWNSGTTIAT